MARKNQRLNSNLAALNLNLKALNQSLSHLGAGRPSASMAGNVIGGAVAGALGGGAVLTSLGAMTGAAIAIAAIAVTSAAFDRIKEGIFRQDKYQLRALAYNRNASFLG